MLGHSIIAVNGDADVSDSSAFSLVLFFIKVDDVRCEIKYKIVVYRLEIQSRLLRAVVVKT